jgi:hypothetical protein
LLGYLDESVSSIQVSLNISRGQDYVYLVVADIASVLRFDDPVVEFPKRFVVFRKLLSECGDDRRVLRKASFAAKQESLRRVEHGIVGTGHREIKISIGREAPAGGHTPTGLNEQRSLIGIHTVTPSVRMFWSSGLPAASASSADT